MASPHVQSPVVALRGTRWTVHGVAAAALLALVAIGASPYARYLHHEYQAPSAAGQLAAVAGFLAGWTLMMLAMMLPTAISLLSAVARLGDEPAQSRRLQLQAAAGFLATWVAVGYAFRTGDVLLHVAVESIDGLEARPRLVAASALAVAGAYQFTALKYRCLTACRSPTTFVFRYWHGLHRSREAVRIGTAYGTSCIGCCWALMLVLFGLGIASVAWMLAVGAVMALEKNTGAGTRLSAPIGVALLAAAALVAIG